MIAARPAPVGDSVWTGRTGLRIPPAVEDAEAWTDAPTLQGSLVVLRPLVAADREGLLTVAADAAPSDNFYLTAPTSKLIDEWLEKGSEDPGYRRSMRFTACRPADGKAIGVTQYVRMNRKHRRLEIGGTFFAAGVRRTGVNTQSKRLLLGYAFDVLQCNSVQIRTDVLHQQSRIAIERLGARCDGLLRRHSVMPNGRVRDLFVYSFVADEWPGVRQHLDHLLASHGGGEARAS